MPVTKICTAATITLGFYAVLLYPVLKTEAQGGGTDVRLPSAPGKSLEMDPQLTASL